MRRLILLVVLAGAVSKGIGQSYEIVSRQSEGVSTEIYGSVEMINDTIYLVDNFEAIKISYDRKSEKRLSNLKYVIYKAEINGNKGKVILNLGTLKKIILIKNKDERVEYILK